MASKARTTTKMSAGQEGVARTTGDASVSPCLSLASNLNESRWLCLGLASTLCCTTQPCVGSCPSSG